MKTRLLLAAATEWRALFWLGAGAVVAVALGNPFPAVVGLGLFVWAIQRRLANPDFREVGEQEHMETEMAARFEAVKQAARETADRWSAAIPQQYRTAWLTRVGRVTAVAQSIYEEWKGPAGADTTKSEMAGEAMRLCQLHLRMLRAYYLIYAQYRPLDLTDVRARLTRNRERIDQLQELEMVNNLREAIELDERLLRQGEDEEAQREQYEVKLSAIESALELLRRKMYDPESSGEGERLHEMLLEAESMEEAMSEVVQRTRVRH